MILPVLCTGVVIFIVNLAEGLKYLTLTQYFSEVMIVFLKNE